MLLDKIQYLYERCHLSQAKGLRLVALRGCKVVNGKLVHVPERVDFFDDRLFFIDDGYIDHVPCTAGQPGWYWLKKQKNTATLRYGQAMYVRGRHKKIYKALRQAPDETGMVPVLRSSKHDGSISYSEDRFDYPIWTGINIHACNGRPDRVGIWSAGCTVVQGDWSGLDWQKLYRLTYQHYKQQAKFPYAILPSEWIDTNSQILLFGSVGDGVKELQEFLTDKGLPTKVTGHFGKETDINYRRWQRMNNNIGNGLCINPPWL